MLLAVSEWVDAGRRRGGRGGRPCGSARSATPPAPVPCVPRPTTVDEIIAEVAAVAGVRAGCHPRRRPVLGDLDGGPEARGVLLGRWAAAGGETAAARRRLDARRHAERSWTCCASPPIGSVDDGKSTLIGRLLFDTRQLFDDQLEAVAAASRAPGRRRGRPLLRHRRAAGRARAGHHHRRRLPLRGHPDAASSSSPTAPATSSTPRNMATGASTADLALVVVDATSGLREQTRRHTCIAALLGVDQLVVVANKMDLVDWDQGAFDRVAEEMHALARRLGVSSVHGDPDLGPPRRQRGRAAPTPPPGTTGPTVLEALESAPAGGWAAAHGTHRGTGARLPVQWVLRHPGGGRSYAGMVNGGPLRPGRRGGRPPGGPAHDHRRSRDLRRAARRGAGRPVGLGPPGRRPRRLARRPHRRGRRPARGDERARGHRLLVRRRARCGPATACGSSTPPGSPRPGSPRCDRRLDVNDLHARAGRRAQRQRHRGRARWPPPPPGRRPLPPRPDHRQLRAGRRGDQRHRGRRHGRPPRRWPTTHVAPRR